MVAIQTVFQREREGITATVEEPSSITGLYTVQQKNITASKEKMVVSSRTNTSKRSSKPRNRMSSRVTWLVVLITFIAPLGALCSRPNGVSSPKQVDPLPSQQHIISDRDSGWRTGPNEKEKTENQPFTRYLLNDTNPITPSLPTVTDPQRRIQGDHSSAGVSSHSTSDSPETGEVTVTNFPTDQPTLSTRTSSSPSIEISSSVPSVVPSDQPPTAPTSAPSNVPSSNPSSDCHDRADYQSPINGLPCEAHYGTNCLLWRFIGLSLSQVEDLVNSCPITCGIECGAFRQFSLSMDFRLSNVPGFLDADTKYRLETASKTFLEKYVQGSPLVDDIAVEITDVELIFQSVVEIQPLKDDLARYLRLDPQVASQQQSSLSALPLTTQQSLQTLKNSNSLDVIVQIAGFSMKLDSATLFDILHEGVHDPAYVQALRTVDDFFDSALVDSNIDVEVGKDLKEDPDVTPDTSRATLFVCLLVPFGVCIVVVGSWAFQRYRSGDWIQDSHAQIGGDAIIRDKNFSSRRSANEELSPSDRIILNHSFVSSDEETVVAGSTKRAVVGGFAGFLTMIGLSPSKSSTERGEGNDNVAFGGNSNSPISKGSSSVNFAEIESAHTQVMPPMIIIKNLDGDEEEDGWPPDEEYVGQEASNGRSTSDRDGDLEAFAMEFRQAIKSHQPNKTLVYPQSFQTYFISHSEDKQDEENPRPRKNSLEMILCSDSEEDDYSHVDGSRSIASTPDLPLQSMAHSPFRRASSFNALDGLEEEHIKESYCTKLPFDSRNGRLTDSITPQVPLTPPPSRGTGVNEDFLFSPSTPPEVIEHGRSRGLPPIRHPFHPPADSRFRSRITKSHTRKHTRKGALSSFSPIMKSIKDSSKKRPKSAATHRDSSCGHHRRTSSSDISDGSRNTTKKSQEDFVRLEFTTPRNGHLGILLDRTSSNRPYIYAVKDYSPLFGMVLKGDELVEIDGKNVSKRNVTDVEKLLNLKPSAYRNSCSSLRITVSRRVESRDDRDHYRANSYGGSSVGSCRILDDVGELNFPSGP